MKRIYGANKTFQSVGKTLARAALYKDARPDDWHIVIASRECGDIDFCRAHGLKKIIACDLDEAARIEADKHDAVVSPCPDVADTVKWAAKRHGQIGTVNVDLCNTLSKGLPVLKRVLEVAPPGCRISFTFLRGRDAASPAARQLALHAALGSVRDLQQIDYQSSSPGENMGSPMTAAIFTAVGAADKTASLSQTQKVTASNEVVSASRCRPGRYLDQTAVQTRIVAINRGLAEGRTLTAIGKELGLSQSAISSWSKLHGIAVPPARRPRLSVQESTKRLQTIDEMRANGATWAAISKALGWTGRGSAAQFVRDYRPRTENAEAVK